MGYGAGIQPGYGAGGCVGYGAGAGAHYGSGMGPGYGAGAGGDAVAPPTISYASPQSWTYGVAISTLSPTTTGATSFAVQSGTLPTGVSLNAGNGDITGTPTTAKVAANVVIRATGPGGTADATINIAVPSPLYTSLVDYWNLDEASGNRAGSHAGLTLTDNNTVTSQATGGPDGGRCAQFTAANSEYLSRADEAAIRVGDFDFTWAGWVYFDSAALAVFVSKDAGGNRDFLYYLNGANLTGNDLSTIANASTVPNVACGTGSWKFVVYKYTQSTRKTSLSLNNAAYVDSGALPEAHNAGTAELRFGMDEANAGLYMDGRMAYFMFAKRVLTANEATWLYNAGAGRTYSALATYDGG